MKNFLLQRNEDESGISGTGVVAEGVEFDNGFCVMNWLTMADEKTGLGSICMYPSIKILEKIHGHDGKTVVQYI